MQNVKFTVASLLGKDVSILSGHEGYVKRAVHLELPFEEFSFLSDYVKHVGVSDEFKRAVDYFKTP